MSEIHSSGSVKRVVRPRGPSSDVRFVPIEKNGIAHKQAPRSGLSPANSLPAAMPATAHADREKIDIWSWMIASFIEGFALYGASFHGAATFALDPHPAKTDPMPLEGNRFHGQRRHISLVASSAGLGEKSPQFEGRTGPAAPGLGKPSTTDGTAGLQGLTAPELAQPNRWHWFTSCLRIMASLWTHRRRERRIKKSVAALANLDDQTLRDMGIPDRSQIEQAVRYCHDC
jgi:hypothetical protein